MTELYDNGKNYKFYMNDLNCRIAVCVYIEDQILVVSTKSSPNGSQRFQLCKFQCLQQILLKWRTQDQNSEVGETVYHVSYAAQSSWIRNYHCYSRFNYFNGTVKVQTLKNKAWPELSMKFYNVVSILTFFMVFKSWTLTKANKRRIQSDIKRNSEILL